MTTTVIALGGSLLRPEIAERHAWLAAIGEIMAGHADAGGRAILVVGGGAPAREGIALAEPVLADVAALDRIGIAATRLNAQILLETLAAEGLDVATTIPTSFGEAVGAASEHAFVVMGGTDPGHTTDNVAIQVAIRTGADRCLIATNVAKVHTADPHVDPSAEPIDVMTLAELTAIVGPPVHGAAGGSGVIDPIGVAAASEAGLRLAVLDGRLPNLIAAALAGEAFEGTQIEVA